MLYNPIGDTILRILARTDTSQSTFASRAGVGDTTVSRWVNGTRPRADQWRKILRGLRCSALDFEIEMARAQCDYCVRQARALGEAIPVFAASGVTRRIEDVLTLDLDSLGDRQRTSLRRLRSLIVTVVTQCEPLLEELEELVASGREAGDSDLGVAPESP